jgi:hypothetical protein
MATIYVRPPGAEAARGYHYHHEGGRLDAPPACTHHEDCKESPDLGRSCWAERSYPHARKLLSARACADTIAAFVGVADFFGGAVDFNDCDDVEWDHAVPDRPVSDCTAEDGDEWDHVQRRLASVEPLTQKQIHEFKKHAAYPDDE